jgi:Putative adhesin
MLRRASSFASYLAAFFSLVFVLASASPCFAITKEFNQTYPLQAGGSFELQNVNGTVNVEAWDRDEVEVRAVKTAKHKESDLELVSIDVDAKPDGVSVTTRYPQNEGVEVAVEYTVHVPHCAHVEHLGTVNGTLRIAGVEAVEDLRTVNGNIEVYDGGGSVHARTTNGNVHLELLHLLDKTGAVAETTNGSVLLAVPADTHADLEALCLNGNFFSELPLALESTQRPRETLGKLGKGGAPIRLHTVNGGIRLIVLRSTV